MPLAEATGAAAKKKSLHAPERDTPRVERLRARWRQKRRGLDPQQLLFVDESGLNLNRTTLRAGQLGRLARATAVSICYTGSCEPTECCQRNCRAFFDRSQPNRFPASPDWKADAALAPGLPAIALAYSSAAGATAFSHRNGRLAVVLTLVGLGGSGLLAPRLETGAE